MYSDVRRGAGSEVEERKGSGPVVLKSEQTCESQSKGGQQKKKTAKTTGTGDEAGLGWSVFVHDKNVLPAVSAGGNKLRSTIEEETFVGLHDA